MLRVFGRTRIMTNGVSGTLLWLVQYVWYNLFVKWVNEPHQFHTFKILLSEVVKSSVMPGEGRSSERSMQRKVRWGNLFPPNLVKRVLRKNKVYWRGHFTLAHSDYQLEFRWFYRASCKDWSSVHFVPRRRNFRRGRQCAKQRPTRRSGVTERRGRKRRTTSPSTTEFSL